MRWTRWTAATTAVAATLAAFASFSCSSSQKTPAAMTAAEKVARGKYLVSAIGCNDCHTPGAFYGAPDSTRFLSGSEIGWVGPWGVAYAANLTADPETGLGTWSEDEIVAAIRTGSRPDGRPLAPIMPWLDFAHLTDADAHAIAAYLMTLPAVKHQEPKIIPPGEKPTGATVAFPPPPAWDAVNLPKPPSSK